MAVAQSGLEADCTEPLYFIVRAPSVSAVTFSVAAQEALTAFCLEKSTVAGQDLTSVATEPAFFVARVYAVARLLVVAAVLRKLKPHALGTGQWHCVQYPPGTVGQAVVRSHLFDEHRS